MINQSDLKELLHYDPETGLFTWAVDKGKVKKHSIAGSLNSGGYIRIGINETDYLAHRLAFLYMTGAFPPDHTDHINGVRDDNRWVNIRTVTEQENFKNQKRRCNNTSGIMGVSWHDLSGKWRARIVINRKEKHMGIFADLFEACCVRKSAELKHGFHANHGRK